MTKGKVLVVEDEAIIAMEMENCLNNIGYEVTSIACSGKEAIQKTQSEKPDLILMDIRIQGEMDGIDAAEEIRKRFGIPVVFSTAYLDQERIDRAKITMPFGYLIKPIQEKELKVTLEMALYVAKIDDKRRQAEEELYNSAFFLNKAQEIAQIGHFSYDPLTGLVEGSRELFRIFDIGVEFPTFEQFSDAIHPDDRDLIFPYIDRAIKEGIPYDVEHRICHRDGTILNVNAKGEIFLSSSGRRLVGVVQDITERKQLNQEKYESEERFRLAFENANIGMCLVSLEGHLLKVNHRMCEIFGYRQDELEKMTVTDITCPEDLDLSPHFKEKIKFSNPDIGRYQKRFFHKDGHLIWALVSPSVIKNQQGQPMYFVTQLRDITERKEAEKKIQLQSRILDAIDRAIIATDLEGQIFYFNRSAAALYQWSEEEALRMNIMQVTVPLQSQSQAAEIMKKLGQGDVWSGEFLVQNRKGTPFTAQVTNSPIFDEDGKLIGIVGISQAISGIDPMDSPTSQSS